MLYKEAIKRWNNGKKQELLNNFYPKFIFNSNKIENSETMWSDVENIFKGQEITGFKGNDITIKEIVNHKKVCDNMLETISLNKSRLSIDLIKQLHYQLANGCFAEELLERGERPGEFKKGYYVVGIHDIGLPPSQVEGSMKDIINEVNDVEINATNALKVVSYLHNCIEATHGFVDFNGRLGRVLINYMLIANDLPPIIVFEDDKKEYYSALEFFNEEQEIDKMVRFLELQGYKTWKDVSRSLE
jgi:Fic family protein